MKLPPTPRGNYQTSDSLMTLREGLEEYYALNPGFDGTGEFLGQNRQTVLDHDVCHVVFGLGTTSREELLVEVITLFGTRIPFKKAHEIYRSGFFSHLWENFGPWRLAKRFTLTLPAMLRAFFMTLHMTKKWPHFSYTEYLDLPLRQIRSEFGIRLL